MINMYCVGHIEHVILDIQNGVGVHCTPRTDVQPVNNERMAQRGREGDK